MKKLLTLILALTMVFSLCACGEGSAEEDFDEDDDGSVNISNEEEMTLPEASEETQPPVVELEPTEEEMNALLAYQEAVNKVTAYHAGESTEIEWRSENDYYWEKHTVNQTNYYVVKAVYDAITNGAPLVEKFANTTFAQTFETNWNPQEVLGWFTVIEDVRIGCSEINVNALGEITSTTDVENTWHYDQNGNELPVWKSSWYEIVSGLPVYNSDVGRLSLNYSYKCVYENGEVTKVQYMLGESLCAVLTPTFGEHGITNCHVLYDNGYEFDLIYTYNENGLLTKIHTEGAYGSYFNAYEYDEQGRMIKSYNQDNVFYEYTYDAEGNHISTKSYEIGLWSGETYSQANISFEKDDQGRVVKAVIVEEGCTNEAKRIYEFTYGDYYILTPAQ